MNFDNEKEISENKRSVKYYYSREERVKNTRLVSPETKTNAFGLFKSKVGKIGLLAFTFLIIAMVWYFNEMNKRSDNPEGSFKTVDNIRYRVYAYKEKNTNAINAFFFIRNKTGNNKLMRFFKVYIRIKDKQGKVLTHREFLKNVKIFLASGHAEQYRLRLKNVKPDSEYTVYAAAINHEKIRVMVKMKVKT